MVRNAAFVVAESGNLMMMPGRAIDDELYASFAQAMVTVGQKAIEVAEARDEMAVFDVGAEMYSVCTGCHATYALELQRPATEI